MRSAMVCSIPHCGIAVCHRGWCKKHYRRWQRHGDPNKVLLVVGEPLSKRFAQHYCVDVVSGCWNWTSSLNNTGYGQIGIAGKCRQAHRVSYELNVGPIPLGMAVCHRCDNPRCVNPAHLFAGTATANMMDMVAKGRHKTKLCAANVSEIRSSTEPLKALARRFGTSISAISRVRLGHTWRHVE